jgi:deoxyribodipyrimidine photo-lyase
MEDPRVTIRRPGPPAPHGQCVVYWMQRAQRGLDNPALDLAIEAGNLLGQPVVVFFGLHPRYPRANLRHYAFLVEGLEETRQRIEERGGLFVFRPYPHHDLLAFCREASPSLVVGDENPMRQPEGWRQSAARQLTVPFWTVDADVIVPTHLFPKEEYAARTIRPKIHRLLPQFLRPGSSPRVETVWPADRPRPTSVPIDPVRLLRELPLDRSVAPVPGARGGTSAGLARLDSFLERTLPNYDTARNLPPIEGTSQLSAYLHFGQLGPLTIALAVEKRVGVPEAARAAFLEELIVRRELAINYVARNPRYDTLQGCHGWAVETLLRHASDPRPYLYSSEQLEQAVTHDPLWNAAQREMVLSGRMHGYLRMYWAKKILEWTRHPEEAFSIAVELNDRYQLDGRDPNGYTGVAWAIGGKHDRPWGPERPIFGLIRYMVASGCARKFSIPGYLARVAALERDCAP